jgi:3-isopropylmalate/(R)-2-methylmalate dehydratase large subunit
MTAKTLFDKIWDAHVVKEVEGGPNVLYIDRHFIHEVTSPVAFLGLKKRGLKVFRPEKTTATPPTTYQPRTNTSRSLTR